MAQPARYAPPTATRVLIQDDQPPSYYSIFNTTPAWPQYDSEPPGYSSPDERHRDSPPPAYTLVPSSGTQQCDAQPTEVVFDTTQNENGNVEEVFAEKSVRSSFTTRVFAILTCQLLVTTGLVALFVYNSSNKSSTQVAGTKLAAYTWATAVTSLVVILCGIALAFEKNVRRWAPANCLLLIIFTLVKSFLLGLISAYCDTQSIFMAVSLTAMVCLTLSVFGFTYGIIISSFVVVPAVSGLFWFMLLQQQLDQVLALTCASIFQFPVGFFLVYDVWQMVHHNKYSILPHELVFAVLSIYWDIIKLVFYVVAMLFIILLCSLLGCIDVKDESETNVGQGTDAEDRGLVTRDVC